LKELLCLRKSSDMEEVIELRFKYSEQEYISAYRKYFLAKKRATFFIVIAASLVLVGIYFLLSGGDVALTVSLIATGAFLLGLLMTSSILLPRQRFRADPRFKGEYFLRFLEDGIEFHTDDIDAKVSWRIYKEALETKDFFLLSDGGSTLSVIPKRVFANAEQEMLFRQLLDTKV
jgi:YcxB-like protein